jgi:hypothetical protein
MQSGETMFVAVVAMRTVAILVGAAFVYMGFRLAAQVAADARPATSARTGTVEIVWGEKRVSLRQASPGIVLALIGAAVIGTALLSRTSYSHEKDGVGNVRGIVDDSDVEDAERIQVHGAPASSQEP